MAGLVLSVLLTMRQAGAQDATWLRDHDRGNRAEGLLDRPNARHSYELLGFYAYREPFALDPASSLHVEFFQPRPETVSLQAKELRNRAQYFMEAHGTAITGDPKGWRHFDDWPIREVLLPSRVPAGNLGVLIRLGSDNEYAEDLAPAVLYARDKPSAIKSYTLYLTANQPLSSLTYTLTPAAEGKRTCSVDPMNDAECTGGEATAPHAIDAGNLIRLHFAAAGLPDHQEIQLHLKGQFANSDGTLDAVYRFFNAVEVR